MTSPFRIPKPSGTVSRVILDPETGFTFILEGGHVLEVPNGVKAAVRLEPSPPLLIVGPRSLGCFSLIIPKDAAQLLAQAFPLAQKIREGRGAKHEA